MKSRLVWLIAALAAIGSAQAAPPEGGLRIATWNVENLDVDAPAWRVRELAAELQRLAADLVFLQEVASARAAERLRDAVVGQGGPRYEVRTVDDARNDQQVVLLSRLRPTRFRAYDFTGMGPRLDRVASADFSLPEGRLRCVAVHLKAGVQDGGDARRRNEQTRQLLRDLVLPGLAEGRRVILLGDLNDIDGEVRYSNGRRPDPLSEVFDLLRQEAPQLRNTDTDLPLRERVSTSHGYMFDHVVADARLAGLVSVSRPSSGSRPASDHYPLAFDLAPLHARPLRVDLEPDRYVPAGDAASDEVASANPGVILGEVTVRVVLTHSRLDDLEVSLTHAGRTALLLRRPTWRERTLDLRVPTDVFAGVTAAGSWRLEVRDRASRARYGGTLRSWALRAAVVDDPGLARR